MILSTPKAGSALAVIAWCIMEELVHPLVPDRRSYLDISSKKIPLSFDRKDPVRSDKNVQNELLLVENYLKRLKKYKLNQKNARILKKI